MKCKPRLAAAVSADDEQIRYRAAAYAAARAIYLDLLLRCLLDPDDQGAADELRTYLTHAGPAAARARSDIARDLPQPVSAGRSSAAPLPDVLELGDRR